MKNLYLVLVLLVWMGGCTATPERRAELINEGAEITESDLKLDQLLTPVAAKLIEKKLPSLEEKGWWTPIAYADVTCSGWSNKKDYEERVLMDGGYLQCHDTPTGGSYFTIIEKGKQNFTWRESKSSSVGSIYLPELKLSDLRIVIVGSQKIVPDPTKVQFIAEPILKTAWLNILKEAGKIGPDFKTNVQGKGAASFIRRHDGTWECDKVDEL